MNLRDVPGATVNHSGGAGGITEVYLRGAQANQTLVLIDGVEVNNPDGGAFDFSSSLLNLEIERIEVLRGPQSVPGSAAIGGVINIITSAPSARCRPAPSSKAAASPPGRAAPASAAAATTTMPCSAAPG